MIFQRKGYLEIIDPRNGENVKLVYHDREINTLELGLLMIDFLPGRESESVGKYQNAFDEFIIGIMVALGQRGFCLVSSKTRKNERFLRENLADIIEGQSRYDSLLGYFELTEENIKRIFSLLRSRDFRLYEEWTIGACMGNFTLSRYKGDQLIGNLSEEALLEEIDLFNCSCTFTEIGGIRIFTKICEGIDEMLSKLKATLGEYRR